MNSRPYTFDWHAPGVWVMHNPVGEPMLEFVAHTPYSCRAEFLRFSNTPWSKAAEAGYYVQQYTPTDPS